MIPPPLIYIACGLQGTTSNVVIGHTPRMYDTNFDVTLYPSGVKLYNPAARVRLYP